jgi:hypothetical protein
MPAVSAASSSTLPPGPAGAGHRTRRCRFICPQCAHVMYCACCSVLGPLGCRPVALRFPRSAAARGRACRACAPLWMQSLTNRCFSLSRRSTSTSPSAAPLPAALPCSLRPRRKFLQDVPFDESHRCGMCWLGARKAPALTRAPYASMELCDGRSFLVQTDGVVLLFW